MISRDARVCVVAQHASCDVSGYDFIIRCNHHQPAERCDLRVVGVECDLSDCVPTVLAVNGAIAIPIIHQIPWILNNAGERFQLWVHSLGLINAYDFVPVTGLVALQIALAFGAKKPAAIGFNFYDGAERAGTHFLPPQREYFKQLVEAGHVEHIA